MTCDVGPCWQVRRHLLCAGVLPPWSGSPLQGFDASYNKLTGTRCSTCALHPRSLVEAHASTSL